MLKTKMSEFKNEVFLDFDDKNVQEKMYAAIERLRADFGKTYPLIINGEEIESKRIFTSINPNNHSEVIGQFAKATQKQAESALECAWDAFETWKRTTPEERSKLIMRTADILRERRYDINAALILEVGKRWLEADGDLAEAIDLCDYYALQHLKLHKRDELTEWPGEKTELRYIPLGAGLVVPPWNFPAAILIGTVAGPVVCGNTTVLKPASDAPLTAYMMFKALQDAGLPKGVVNFLTGSGGEIGDFLVEHPKTRFINFTGSRDVGLHINELAARHQKGQLWIKRVSVEMGGKDAIVVAEDADLDKAAQGIVAAAYGYQGQKCSACSRAIIVESVYDEMLKLLKTAAEALIVGPTEKHTNFMGAVVSKSAYEKILKYIAIGNKEGRLLTGGNGNDHLGYIIQPTIFADIPPDARLAQEEVFGPVLAVIKAKDFDDALAIANNTEYGLTGAVYCADPEKQERAKDDFHVGNLYINRKCSGAVCGVHPFGGFNMSGTCSKAGGPDYLLLYTQQKSIGEKVN